MEHESFENAEIAAYLNEHFIPIKVDREERPDLDQIYMNAVQAMTGRGGWPMSVFLTPDLKPFYGGTYWPPTAGRGMPGFNQVLAAVQDAWTNRREQALETADKLTEKISELSQVGDDQTELTHDLIRMAARHLERSFDVTYGGFGEAPKFPHTMDLDLLLRNWKSDGRGAWLDMVRHTLDRMAAGGIYDHLGGGFARYSVDERWLVPHFEKMLYDNALLAKVYAETYAALPEEDSFKPEAARIVRETLDYVLRDMTHPEGGFYSTEDADSLPFDQPEGADSEGHAEEGLFYTWKSEEVRKLIGEESGDIFCRVFDVSPIGNFEGRNILNLPKSIDSQATLMGMPPEELTLTLAKVKEKLLEARAARPRPGLDDKVLTSWNGLMIDAMARAGSLLGETRYVEAANRAADFLLAKLVDEQGQLLHTWRHGKAKLPAFLDDYTALANGLISLYEATFNERRIDQAAKLLDKVLEDFSDAESGGFFYTATGQESLIVRNKELTDNATPGGNSLAATALIRLGKLTGNANYLDAANQTLIAASSLMGKAPGAMGQMLVALDLQLGSTRELVLVGPTATAEPLLAEIRGSYLPRCILAGRLTEGSQSQRLTDLFAGKQAINGEPTLYVCEGQSCQEPAVGVDAIRELIKSL